MSKKRKKDELEKALVEKILDREKIPYEQKEFEIHGEYGVFQMDTSILEQDQRLAYKTLACEGNKTGPLVAALPITEHLDLKKLAKVSGNKKCEMLPLEKLEKTADYVHGANTPIGTYFNDHYPIYLDNSMRNKEKIVVSSEKVGRSVQLALLDLQKVVEGTFGDLLEK